MQRHRVAPRVTAEQVDVTLVGAQQPEQDADGGCLPGTVRPEEAVHLARLDPQVEMVEGPGPGPEVLHQSRDRDRGAHGDHFPSLSGFWRPDVSTFR